MIEQTINKIRPLLVAIAAQSSINEESRRQVSLSGATSEDILPLFISLLNALSVEKIEDCVAIDIDGSQVGTDDIDEIISIKEYLRPWSLLLNKDYLLSRILPESDCTNILFFSVDSFLVWSDGIDPFKKSDIFIDSKSVKIFVDNLPSSFGGPKLAVVPLDQSGLPDPWPFPDSLPQDESIRTQVHIATADPISFKPSNFLLTWGDSSSEHAKVFRRNSGLTLAACLVQDFFGRDRVVLRGIKRVELPLVVETDEIPAPDFLEILRRTVEWVYEERVETRAKLFTDRLSLEINSNRSFLLGLYCFVEDALNQSREQYGFVILDRKDAYVKELRDLLKDVRTHGDLCIQKVRNILGNLLRDVIATFILISISLLTRLGNNPHVLASREADLLFKALAIYLFFSPIFQFSVDVLDIRMTNKENHQWIFATRSYMPATDIDKYFNSPIRRRIRAFYFYASFFAVIYFLLAYASWNAQTFLKSYGIIHSQKNSVAPDLPGSADSTQSKSEKIR